MSEEKPIQCPICKQPKLFIIGLNDEGGFTLKCEACKRKFETD